VGGLGTPLIRSSPTSAAIPETTSTKRIISFYLPTQQSDLDFDDAEAVLATFAPAENQAAGVVMSATLETSRGLLTYWWWENGDQAGELVLNLNGQEIYRGQVEAQVRQANQNCEAQKLQPIPANKPYGCVTLDSLDEPTRKEPLVWEQENDWVHLKFALTEWYGHYDLATDEQTFDFIRGWVGVTFK
jgi:hypothetical protein